MLQTVSANTFHFGFNNNLSLTRRSFGARAKVRGQTWLEPSPSGAPGSSLVDYRDENEGKVFEGKSRGCIEEDEGVAVYSFKANVAAACSSTNERSV